jgi:DNA repair exonuclease SbcCD nuclease subunit
MRFLHLADVHLDTPFAGRSPAVRSRLRLASREALSAAVDCALAERVDVVLIAGDLFDGERLSFGTELFLLEQLRRLRDGGIPVVYASGNHDPGSRGGRTLAWPENVALVGDARPRRIAIRRRGEVVGFVTAAGHAGPRETADLSRTFPKPPGELPEVALLHTQVGGAREGEEHHPYAPSQLSTLLASGYHYWALGHIHLRQCLSDLPAVHFPGNLQGRTARERGPKGGLLVDVTRVGPIGSGAARPNASGVARPIAYATGSPPRVEFRSFAPVRFETLEVRGLDGESSVPGLVSRVTRAWREARLAEVAALPHRASAGGTPPPQTSRDWIVRVVLSGPTPLARELEDPDDRTALARELEQSIGALDVDVWTRGTHAPAQPADHRGRVDVLGEALRLLEDVGAGRAELSGLRAEELAGPEAREDLAAYVRARLAGSGGELVARLLGGGGR